MSDRLLTAATVLFLLGTLGLYCYSLEVKPLKLGSGGVGSYVYLEGMVRQVRKGWGAELRAEVMPEGVTGGAPAPVWLIADDALQDIERVRDALLTGARVRAEGVLSEYKGTRELQLADAADLSLLSPSSMKVVWDRTDVLDNTSVALRGVAYYKHVRGGYLTMKLVDPGAPVCVLDCSSSDYHLSEENPRWENGTQVTVMGWLRYRGDPVAPRLYISGGAKGVSAGG